MFYYKQEIVADERTSAHALTLLAVSGGEAGRNGLVSQALRLRVVEDGGVRVETFRHPITDQVNQTLKDNVHIDVVLRRCLEKPNSCMRQKRGAQLPSDDR